MIEIDIPGSGIVHLDHLVLDVNGTLAVDGELIPGIPALLHSLGATLEVHLLTADTHGKQSAIDQQLGLEAVRIQSGEEAHQKAEYLKKLGQSKCGAIGQGANDSLMLKEAKIGICVLSPEGTALETLLQADLIVPDIITALTILSKPKRLKASLRK